MSEQVNCLSDCPNLISPYKTPKILWYQTGNAVFIRILLPDIERYHLKVTDDTFTFRTDLKDGKYFVGIKLCGTVVAEKSSHQKLGRELKVCLIKAHRWTDWPRLHLSRDKNSFISQDPEHIIKKKWDDPYAPYEQRESFEEYKKRMGITNIMPEGSSEEDGTDSDDEKLIGYDEI
ncbi:uncharacterized protein LOC106636882 [Copidosoma floridanum]|uniref:uncharacterized protein LOC106636882 n=1 Tax=Copidosoma floridanum TaxID=29053 RepID=UPI0006C9CCBB|nr:uncharacterized protein LOC106636882 [Copidosoma floridanum]